MSLIPITAAIIAASTAATTAAATARRRREQLEEEQSTGYRKDDLEGWEFKIVRTATRRFRRPDAVRQLCDEEARAGWEMLEKLDDCRIRFKRSVEHRAHDAYLDGDPYRTQVGISANRLELSIAAGVVLAMGVVLLAAMLVFGLGR